jgi:endonuclease/exonuclease/phosphatase family metal-dependent hydrolase
VNGTRRRSTVAAAGGLVASPVILLLQQVHYKRPLPIDDVLIVLATAAVIGTAALRRPTRHDSRPAPRLLIPVGIAVTAIGLTLGAVLTASAPDPPDATLPGTDLRVVGYNVDNAISTSGHLHPQDLADDIESLSADIVVLQEVPRGLGWSASLDLATWLSRRLGMTYAFVPTADHTLGNLILSRTALRDVLEVPLPRLGNEAQRAALLATIDLAGTPVTVINVHLQHGRSEAATDARLDQLRTTLRAWNGRAHTILVGDLNAGPGSPEVNAVLSAGFTTSADTTTCTQATRQGECLDWTFVTPDLQHNLTEVLPIGTSDHWPTINRIVIGRVPH